MNELNLLKELNPLNELNLLKEISESKALPLDELIRKYAGKGTIVTGWGTIPPPSHGPLPKPKAKPKRSYLTPPQYAGEIGVSEDKVLGWINTGQLKAINAAQNPKSKRPRWRITREEIERFEAGRTVEPPAPKPKRRKRSKPPRREWF